MPRLKREQLRSVEEQQRHVITTRPTTVGGFPFAAMLPFLAAAATPLITSGSKWVGKKIFGQGIQRAGAGAGAGLQRAGEKPTPIVARPIMFGKGAYRSGDYPMPSMAPLPHHKSSTTRGLPGAGLSWNPMTGLLPNPIKTVVEKLTRKGKGKCKGKGKGKGTAAMKAKMAALRALKKKA